MNTPAPLSRPIATILGILIFAGCSVVAPTPLASIAAPAPAPAATPAPPASQAKAPVLKDAAGRTLRRAPTGHISNYYEDKIPPYTLPDPLVLKNGQPVRDADTWFK